MSQAPAFVAVSGISKRFGATLALDDVTVDFHAGEVHALVGENGAGKSTLGKILVGAQQPDTGSLSVDGTSADFFASPAHAARAGFVGVAQELALIPMMTGVDNVVLGNEPMSGPFVNAKRARRIAEALSEEHQFDLDLQRRVDRMSIADQQKVELLRALSRQMRLVVFDEPTARLASHEAVELRRTVRQLASNGVAVVYVSHFLDEVLDVADRITTMRDGRVVRTSDTSNETHETLVEAMTGRTIDSMFPELPVPPSADAPVVLHADSLSASGLFDEISLTVSSGEIVGLAGLVGSGRSEVAHAIYGSQPIDSGKVTIRGEPHRGGVPAGLSEGIAMIPESRRDQGLVMNGSVADNAALSHLETFSRGIVLRQKAMATATAEACAKATVKAVSPASPITSLSGGNQQKVMFARALMSTPSLLIADEPTRGVDVGAKQGIYALIAGLAAEGSGVLLISSELDEVLGMSHRVLVMRNGRIVDELSGVAMTEANVLAAAFGEADNAHEGDPT